VLAKAQSLPHPRGPRDIVNNDGGGWRILPRNAFANGDLSTVMRGPAAR